VSNFAIKIPLPISFTSFSVLLPPARAHACAYFLPPKSDGVSLQSFDVRTGCTTGAQRINDCGAGRWSASRLEKQLPSVSD
jgi:hypothetical protein